MVDVVGFAAGAFQGNAALNLAPVAQAFSRQPGVLSGIKLIDTAVAAVGIERITAQVVKYGVKLALRADHSTETAAAEMVELMRSRVPVDSGNLLNGIAWHKSGHAVTVEAIAVNVDYDYALAVEAGHHAGNTHADASLFEDTTGRGYSRPSRATGGSDVPAHPFFYGSARETLAAWRDNLSADATAAYQESAS
ncbi:hypothetical protein MMMDOFMJ_1663 [Methylobacterium gnaphalii]|uniref:HK97 gp10 family phage protein n=2 Tax=Methylobacterium gnaphalii TaxID=1010610 RepID=A0A512JQL5_9HYPH|nr:hypothetical protein MGN01_41020 [Methylobacterium gnaphalii]GJD68739.1 hypothetical protein MMMDOFMJ_1663 [Methylobacterium gnaphalii]GLS49364.1 hypothetical protein GCM10007885_22120 [Methylobacterium gnaphalii]